MTEFKKCGAGVEAVRQATARLADREWVLEDVDRAKDQMEDSASQVRDLHTRVGKMLVKAREKDPDRQIYNEAMCAKIEAFAVEAEASFDAFEGVVDFINEEHYALLLRRAADASREAQLASNTQELGKRERDERCLIEYESAGTRSGLFKQHTTESEEALARQRAREAAELAAETARREAERAAAEELRVGAAAWDERGYADFVRDRLQPLEARERTSLLGHIVNLLDLVVADPSYEGIRRLRNRHPSVLEHFGHPYPETVRGDSTVPVSVSRRYAAFESIAVIAGYLPRYSNSVLGPQGTGCDGLWRVGEEPWAKFGERLLELDEPDPASDPDTWMAWKVRLQDVHAALVSLSRK